MAYQATRIHGQGRVRSVSRWMPDSADSGIGTVEPCVDQVEPISVGQARTVELEALVAQLSLSNQRLIHELRPLKAHVAEYRTGMLQLAARLSAAEEECSVSSARVRVLEAELARSCARDVVAIGALSAAAQRGDAATVLELLARGADLAETCEQTGFSPLHHAAANGHAEVVAALLARGAAIDAPSRAAQARTALHYAAANGHADVVALLLERGADAHAKDSVRVAGAPRRPYRRALLPLTPPAPAAAGWPRATGPRRVQQRGGGGNSPPRPLEAPRGRKKRRCSALWGGSLP